MRKLIYVSGAIAIVALAAVAYSESKDSDTFHRKYQQATGQGQLFQPRDVPQQQVVQFSGEGEIASEIVTQVQVAFDEDANPHKDSEPDHSHQHSGHAHHKDSPGFSSSHADPSIPELQEMLNRNMQAIQNLKRQQEKVAQSNEDIYKRMNGMLSRAFPKASLAEVPSDSSRSAQHRRAKTELARSRSALRSGMHSDSVSQTEPAFQTKPEVLHAWLTGFELKNPLGHRKQAQELKKMQNDLILQQQRLEGLNKAVLHLSEAGFEDMAGQALVKAHKLTSQLRERRERLVHMQQKLKLSAARQNYVDAIAGKPGRHAQKDGQNVLKKVLHEIRALRGEVRSLRKEVRKVRDAVVKTKKSAALLVPRTSEPDPFGERPAKPPNVFSPAVGVDTFDTPAKPRKHKVPRKPARSGRLKKNPAADPQPALFELEATNKNKPAPDKLAKPAKTVPKKATAEPFDQEDSSDPFGSAAPSGKTPEKTTTTKTETSPKDQSSKPPVGETENLDETVEKPEKI